LTKVEALNKPLVSSFTAPELRNSVQNIMDNAWKGKETSTCELEFCTKSNETRHFPFNATSPRDVEYNIAGGVGVAQDVTEAAKHDRAVASMAARELRQLDNTANAPIFGIHVLGDVNE
jgi:hypothetical protein